MPQKELKRLLQRFEKEKEELLSIRIFRKGSITKRWMTCGNPICKCKIDKAKRHGPYYWWTTKQKGRTQAIIVPKEFLSEAKIYLKNYKQLKMQINVLSQLSERIIRKKLKFAKRQEIKKP